MPVIRVQPLDRRLATPDFVIAGKGFAEYGRAAAKAMGFFSPSWDLANGDYCLDRR